MTLFPMDDMTDDAHADHGYTVRAGPRDWTLHVGDSREMMRLLPDASVDSCVCDPPYELGFMGKAWDATGIAYDVGLWREVLRVLKPGGHLLAFGGTRTHHRMACAIEDAGFAIRDMMAWAYSTGFPKSLDVSKAIDAQVLTGKTNSRAIRVAKDAREVVGTKMGRPGNSAGQVPRCGGFSRATKSINSGVDIENEDERLGASLAEGGHRRDMDITKPKTEQAKQWQGWGTALKPAWEPICVARKPLAGTVAQNVIAHGTGALNVDACRVGTEEPRPALEHTGLTGNVYGAGIEGSRSIGDTMLGRWPANILHDGSADVLACFPQSNGQQGNVRGTEPSSTFGGVACGPASGRHPQQARGDAGSAARFFYCAKTSTWERNAGCLHLPARTGAEAVDRDEDSAGVDNPRAGAGRKAQAVHNFHPTVKPVDLMRYMVTLVTPVGGLVLDPFAGSGSTGCGAMLAGCRFHGIELDTAHAVIAHARITWWERHARHHAKD